MGKEHPFCCRCGESFPLAKEPAGWTLGTLRPLRKAPKAIKDRYRGDPNAKYLCGNCFFDLTDE